MTRIIRAALLISACACGVASVARLGAQIRGGEWTTSGFDAQRTAWIRSDAKITKDILQKGTFQFLWKAKFDNEARQLNSLTQPVLQDWLVGYRGFKALAFVGGSADRLFAIDTDLGRPYWTTHLTYAAATGGQPPSSWDCPGGLIATPSRRTVLAPSTFGAGLAFDRGAKATSAVGEPGKGAAVLSEASRQSRGPVGPPPSERSGDTSPSAGKRPRNPVAPVPFGGVDPLYVVGSDGLLRTLRVSDGADMAPAVAFLPPNARPSSLVFIEGVVYTTTSHDCGAAPNGVWAIDLTDPDKKVSTFKTGGVSVAGSAGPTFGTDGTLYVALGSDPSSAAGAPATDGQKAAPRYANAVVALDRDTLAPKDWFTAEGADFNTSPMVVRHKDKDLVAVTANDGRLYLLDGAALGGADHKTPLHVTPKYTAPGTGAALATWEDEGTRWILAPVSGAAQPGVKFTAAAAAAPAPAAGPAGPAAGPGAKGSIVAFKLVDEGGKVTLVPGWQSRNLVSPLAPIVINNFVFAVSSGEYRGADARLAAAQRAQRSLPAVLYALDGTTGKELWTSGKTITSFARAGLAAGAGQVYLVTYDNQLYAFGSPMEH